MITRRGLLSALASLPIVASFHRVSGAGPTVHDAFGDKAKDIAVGLDDPNVRIVWVSGPRRSGKSFMARYLLAVFGSSGHPITLHVPTDDDRRGLCLDVGLAHQEVSTGLMPLRRRSYKYVIIDHYEGHRQTGEGDVVALAAKRTKVFEDGKVIVFSELEPRGWKNIHHVRFAPIV